MPQDLLFITKKLMITQETYLVFNNRLKKYKIPLD